MFAAYLSIGDDVELVEPAEVVRVDQLHMGDLVPGLIVPRGCGHGGVPNGVQRLPHPAVARGVDDEVEPGPVLDRLEAENQVPEPILRDVVQPALPDAEVGVVARVVLEDLAGPRGQDAVHVDLDLADPEAAVLRVVEPLDHLRGLVGVVLLRVGPQAEDGLASEDVGVPGRDPRVLVLPLPVGPEKTDIF